METTKIHIFRNIYPISGNGKQSPITIYMFNCLRITIGGYFISKRVARTDHSQCQKCPNHKLHIQSHISIFYYS